MNLQETYMVSTYSDTHSREVFLLGRVAGVKSWRALFVGSPRVDGDAGKLPVSVGLRVGEQRRPVELLPEDPGANHVWCGHSAE